MLWIVLFFIIILISAVLAFRSMKDYEEFPDAEAAMGLFYIAKPSQLTKEVLARLHELFLAEKQFFSLEKLYKGGESALVIFGSRHLIEDLSELNLVEIEDYLNDSQVRNEPKKVGINQSLTWVVGPKNASKGRNFLIPELKELKLKENQRFFIQLVCMPEQGKGMSDFQATIRVMVVDDDSAERVRLAKEIQAIFTKVTGLNKIEDDYPESKKFDSFMQRSLIPKEVSQFALDSGEILDLVS